MIYKTYFCNYAVYPDREKALYTFLNATLERNGKIEKVIAASPIAKMLLRGRALMYCGNNRTKKLHKR
ncbi:MAG: hypothetical protein LBU83_05735 [Bacteroidales bacterium]|jgi:hypothetical protein|nr:hypothetical protein [Bacteroidales bacterium]